MFLDKCLEKVICKINDTKLLIQLSAFGDRPWNAWWVKLVMWFLAKTLLAVIKVNFGSKIEHFITSDG